MPRNKGHRGVAWDLCDRCGFEYPVSKLGIQNGYKLCYDKCWDKRPVGFEEAEDMRVQEMIGLNPEEGSDTRWNEPLEFGDSFING
jgi:hypothetical protein